MEAANSLTALDMSVPALNDPAVSGDTQIGSAVVPLPLQYRISAKFTNQQLDRLELTFASNEKVADMYVMVCKELNDKWGDKVPPAFAPGPIRPEGILLVASGKPIRYSTTVTLAEEKLQPSTACALPHLTSSCV
jgi:hypothetical protein